MCRRISSGSPDLGRGARSDALCFPTFLMVTGPKRRRALAGQHPATAPDLVAGRAVDSREAEGMASVTIDEGVPVITQRRILETIMVAAHVRSLLRACHSRSLRAPGQAEDRG